MLAWNGSVPRSSVARQAPSRCITSPLAVRLGPGRPAWPGSRSTASRIVSARLLPSTVAARPASGRRWPGASTRAPGPASSRACMRSGRASASNSARAERVTGASSTASGASAGQMLASSAGRSAGSSRPSETRIGVPRASPESRTGTLTAPARSSASPSPASPPPAARRRSMRGSSRVQVRPAAGSVSTASPPLIRMRRSAVSASRSEAGSISPASRVAGSVSAAGAPSTGGPRPRAMPPSVSVARAAGGGAARSSPAPRRRAAGRRRTG